MEELLLTLCIPTNGAVKWVESVVKSIYCQHCNEKLFEVIVVDNGEKSDLEALVRQLGHSNLKYIHSDVKGFSNQVAALKYGNGKYIKLLNHRSLLVEGGLDGLLEMVNQFKSKRPVIFCSNGQLGNKRYDVCGDFDEFMQKLSFWSSWSEGVGIWKEDLSLIDNLTLNQLFPAASLLFAIASYSDYVIWNDVYEKQQVADGKGGYNFFHAFAVVFLDMVNGLRQDGRISISTFNGIRKNLYRKYLIGYYYKLVVAKNNYTFDLSDIRKNFTVYYNLFYYYWMVLYSNTGLRIKNIINSR